MKNSLSTIESRDVCQSKRFDINFVYERSRSTNVKALVQIQNTNNNKQNSNSLAFI